MRHTENSDKEKQSPSLLKVIQSVFAAIFGVQSDKNRESDFKQGDPAHFIIVGVLVVVGIVIGMIILVSNVLDSAQSTL